MGVLEYLSVGELFGLSSSHERDSSKYDTVIFFQRSMHDSGMPFPL